MKQPSGACWLLKEVKRAARGGFVATSRKLLMNDPSVAVPPDVDPDGPIGCQCVNAARYW